MGRFDLPARSSEHQASPPPCFSKWPCFPGGHLSGEGFLSDAVFLPCCQHRIIAVLSDARLARAAGPVQRGFLGILLRSGSLPITQTKFLRYPQEAALDMPRLFRVQEPVHRLRSCSPSTKGKHHEQQTNSPSLCRQHAEERRRERHLAGSRSGLAAQERQGLRCSPSRRHQRAWPYRLHGAEEGRRQGVIACRSPELRFRRAVFIRRMNERQSIAASHSMQSRNSAPSFCSYRPRLQPPPCFSRARRESALPLDVAGNPKASPRNGLTFSSLTAKSFRRRNAKSLAANRVPRFTRRMSGANNAGSKLSAVRPRQNRRRRAVPCFDNLARWAKPPVASPLVPQAATETVPVSAPFGLSCGVRHAAVSRPVEVRP